MKQNKFIKMNEKEQANSYGGFLFVAIVTAVVSVAQLLVTSGLAIYQAVTKKSGSVSFGGSRTITNKETVVAKPAKTKSAAGHAAPPAFFSAY